MITILQSFKDCAKTHRWTGDEWTTTPFDNAKTFVAETVDAASIYDLHDVLRWLEQEPQRCMIHGELIGGRDPKGSRLLHDQPNGEKARFRAPEAAKWLCLDIDTMPCPEHLREGDDADVLLARINHVVSDLPTDFQDVSFAYQWSAGAGLRGWNPLKIHLYFWLANARTLAEIKERAAFEAWPVDLAPINPVQIHYTSAPRFVGRADPLAGRRTGFVQRDRDALTLQDWTAPARPIFTAGERLERIETGQGLAELLDAVGVGGHLHGPIQKVIAHYIVMTPPAERDAEWLKRGIRERALSSGRSTQDVRDHTNDAYLDRSYAGADYKYEPLDTERMRLSLARQTLKNWKKKGTLLRK